MKFTVNAAKDEGMEHFINEVNHVNASMMRMLMVPNPDLVQVLQQFFEPESHLHNFLMKEVNEFEDYALFLRFLENFFYV